MPSLKDQLKQALETADYDRIAALAMENNRVFGLLISMAYNKNDVTCWHAIDGMTAAVKASDPDRPEVLRNIVRRLIASAREESGGMSWSAPELLAAIVSARPRAFTDIPPIIVSLHVEDEENVFRKGVLWALGRMGEAGIDQVNTADEVLEESLTNADPSVRGMAAWAVGKMGMTGLAPQVEKLSDDQATFRIYDGGELKEMTVAEAAGNAFRPARI